MWSITSEICIHYHRFSCQNVCHETEVILLKPHGLYTGGHWITVWCCLTTSTKEPLFQVFLRGSKKTKEELFHQMKIYFSQSDVKHIKYSAL